MSGPPPRLSRREAAVLVAHALGRAAAVMALPACAGSTGPCPRPAPAPAAAPFGTARDVASLRAMAGRGAPLVQLLGFARPGDGGGGLFAWSDAPARDDGGTSLNAWPGGPAPGWRRVFEGALDVRWFGARGDGTSDDGPALEAALAAAWLRGCAVHLPPGEYAYERTLVLAQKTVLFGDGDGSRLSYRGKAAAILWQAERDAARGTLSAFQLTSPASTGSTIGIDVVDGSCRLRDLWIHGIDAEDVFTACGVRLRGLTFNTSNTVLEGCRIQQCTGDGIQVPGRAFACAVRESSITGNGGWGVNASGGYANKAQLSVYDCDLEGNVRGGITGSFSGATVRGCYFEQAARSRGAFIDLSPGEGGTYGLVVEANVVHLNPELGAPYGINLQSHAGTFSVTCIGNHVSGAKVAAIRTLGTFDSRFEGNYADAGPVLESVR